MRACPTGGNVGNLRSAPNHTWPVYDGSVGEFRFPRVIYISQKIELWMEAKDGCNHLKPSIFSYVAAGRQGHGGEGE